MKFQIIILAWVVCFLALIILLMEIQTVGIESRPVPIVREPVDIVNLLINCESNGNPDAFNPKDTDGFPRYGILQFSTTTFAWAKKHYDVKGSIWNPDVQIKLGVLMVSDGLAGEWGCYKKIK